MQLKLWKTRMCWIPIFWCKCLRVFAVREWGSPGKGRYPLSPPCARPPDRTRLTCELYSPSDHITNRNKRKVTVTIEGGHTTRTTLHLHHTTHPLLIVMDTRTHHETLHNKLWFHITCVCTKVLIITLKRLTCTHARTHTHTHTHTNKHTRVRACVSLFKATKKSKLQMHCNKQPWVNCFTSP